MLRQEFEKTPKGTPGRRWLRKLNPESVAIAKHNSANERFQEKFKNPRSERAHDALPASPWLYIIRRWRDKHGLFLKEAAAIMGVPFETYRSWEKGKHSPTPNTRRLLDGVMKEYDRATDGKKAA